MRKSVPRDYTIDGKPYSVSISAGKIDREGDVHLRVTFRALYGTRSVCLVRGVTNRSYWHDYPDVESMRERSISLTPRVVCELVRLAHRAGWAPATVRSNFRVDVTRDDIRAIVAVSDPAANPASATTIPES
jgi:hypothetical protein